jgi:hypothetical protein
MRFVVLDIETDFEWSRVDMVGLYDPLSKEGLCAKNPEEVLMFLGDKETTLVTWNGARFDLPLLERIWDLDLSHHEHLDGMLLQKLMMHGVPGGHSLEAAAKRMFPRDKSLWKAEIDFLEASPSALEEYCIQDCKVTWAVVKEHLLSTLYTSNKNAWKKALKVEQKVAKLVDKQVQEEVFFDTARGKLAWSTICHQMDDIESAAEEWLPTVQLPESKLHYPPKVQFKKDGTPSMNVLKYCTKYGRKVIKTDGIYHTDDAQLLPLTKPFITDYKIEMHNQAELKDWLLAKGWVPTEWNTKRNEETGKYENTSPRLTNKISKEPCSGLALMGFPHAAEVSRWLMLRSRKNILKSDKGTGWIPKAEASPTSSIPSDADSMGANTCRWTHKVIANVPRVSSEFGDKIRDCFRAREGKVWVGWDASSLEACVEAHYTFPYDDGEYARELMDGDVHTKNQLALGLPSRDLAKTFKYAITYGAQPKTLSKTLGGTEADAKRVYEEFWVANPALTKLKSDLVKEWEINDKKYIKGLDGRKIWTRSEHSLINALFQSAGAVIMKYSMLIADHWIGKCYWAGLDMPKGLIRYHDEEIWECDNVQAETVSTLGINSIVEAGKQLGLNVPLSADAKIGQSWADVH